MSWCAFDLEDNSRELLEINPNEPAYKSEILQIAAVDEDGERFYFGRNYRVFLEFIACSKYDTFYGHNVGYDLGVLFRNRLDDIDCTFVGGRLIKASYAGKIFLDSFNLYPMALAKVGTAFGLQKLALDEQSKEYIYRDCEITRLGVGAMQAIARSFGIEKLPNTLGGLASKIYKTLGNGDLIYDDISCGYDRPPYLYGGRVELFRDRVRGQIKYTDINSLYPSVMRGEFPTEVSKVGTKKLERWGISKVTVRVPNDTFVAPFPVRREDGSIWYPVGEISGWYCNVEIQNGLDNGCELVNIHEQYASEGSVSPYKSYVEMFYDKRLKCDNEADKLMLKLLMNNLYGQLCVSGEIGRWCYQTDLNVTEGTKLIGKKVLSKHKTPLPEHCNYVHGAHITAYARIKLFNYMKMVKPENLIYCDTDSIIFNGEIPFPISDKLGEMKLENTANFAATHAPKMYQFGKDFKAKGVKKEQAEEFIKERCVITDRPFRLKESCHYFYQDCEVGKPRASVWRAVKKNIRTQYDKKDLRKGRYYPIINKSKAITPKKTNKKKSKS